jgi:quercetin dioxygenase-like cupin family protein
MQFMLFQERTMHHNPANRPYKELRPGVRTRTFWGENMLAGVVDLDANTIVPAHSHPQEQCTYLLEGELVMEVGGQKHAMRPGEMFIIPGNVEHGVYVGPNATRVLDVFSPAREDMKY